MLTRRTCLGRVRRELTDERGFVIIFMALGITAMVGFAALSLDAGQLFAVRQRLSDVADAAALAGGQLLPKNPAGAKAVALAIAEQNGVDPERVTVEFAQNNERIIVSIKGDVRGAFGPSVGMTAESRLGGRAAAQTGILGGARGAQPWGIEDPGPSGFSYGQKVQIKLGSGGSKQGNFHALALGGTGAHNYYQNIVNGWAGMMRVQDDVPTEPGNMVGPTRQGLKARLDADPFATFEDHRADSPRILLLPVVSPFTDSNGRDLVHVLGFAVFFLEGLQGNDGVVGRFFQRVVDGEMLPFGSAPSYGSTTTVLVE